MNHLHLAYLQQVSQLINDKHKPLAAYYAYISKKIELKHLVHIRGADPPKTSRCKACQAPITCDNIQSRAKKLVVKCSLCGFIRMFSNSRKYRLKSYQKPVDEINECNSSKEPIGERKEEKDYIQQQDESLVSKKDR